MKPGPETSTDSQRSSSEAAATIWSAQLPRVAAQALGQGQGAVGLEVGVVRRAQDRVRPRLHRVEGRLQTDLERGLRVDHGPSSRPRPTLPATTSARPVRVGRYLALRACF